MSDFFKKDDVSKQETDAKQEVKETAEEKEVSTIFSAPVHKEKKVAAPKKKRALAIVSALLAVAVLSTGIFAAIKWIPKKEDGSNTSSSLQKVSVIKMDKANAKLVTVNNKNGKFEIYSEDEKVTDEEGKTSTQKVWGLKSLERKFTSSTKLSSIAASATTITAIREIDTKTASECGFDEPSLTVDVTLNEEEKSYSILIGDDSLDKTGVYLKLSNSDKIYLIDSAYPTNFEFELIDLANDSSFGPTEFEGDVSDYFDENGNLSDFDYLKLSGTNFPKTITVEPNRDNAMTSVISFLITSPEERYANNIEGLLGVFTSGISVSGAYTFDVSKESIKKYGLDNPDVVLTLKLGNEVKTYKFNAVDSEYCAVINDDSYMIKKVPLPNIPYASYTSESLYSPWVCMDSITDMETLTITNSGKTYVFDIIHNEVEEGEDGDRYTIMLDGKKLDLKNFQEFYMYFVGIKCSNYSVDKVKNDPDAVVKLDMLDGSVKTLTFTYFNDTKYQAASNGQVLGKISSTYYNKFIKYLGMVIKGETISK